MDEPTDEHTDGPCHRTEFDVWSNDGADRCTKCGWMAQAHDY